jgi:hypothetical protein
MMETKMKNKTNNIFFKYYHLQKKKKYVLGCLAKIKQL